MSKGGYHAWITMLDNGFLVEAIPADDESGVYNMFSTIQDSIDEEDSIEEPCDNSQIQLIRQDAMDGLELLKKRKRG